MNKHLFAMMMIILIILATSVAIRFASPDNPAPSLVPIMGNNPQPSSSSQGISPPSVVPPPPAPEARIDPSLARFSAGEATSNELAAAIAFLRLVQPPAGWSRDRLFNAKDEVMNALDTATNPPPELTGVLVALSRDTTQLEPTRDYAIQHLATLYDTLARHGQQGGLTAGQWRGSPGAVAVRQALWDATAETQNGIGGTALLSLLRLARDYPEADGPRLQKTVLGLARDESCGELTRLTAVSVCGRLGLKEALPVAERLAMEGKTPHLRIAAIAALGNLGDAGVLERLEILAHDPSEARVRTAATAAVKRIRNREARG